MTRALIVDDHAIVRAGIRRLLAPRADIECLDAETGEAALALAAREPFQIAILDLNLPGLGGPALIRALIETQPRLKVLVFSTHTEPIYVNRSLEAGAQGYVSKNAPPEELGHAVDVVLRGRRYIEADLDAELLDDEFRSLTSRELEIMRLLARGRSLTQIAAVLGIAYKTAANTCTRIKEKLGASHTADLLRISIERGLF